MARMHFFVHRFLVWLPSAIAGGMAAMMGTDPDQAVTNLSKWYGKVAVPPEWMQVPSPAYAWAMWLFAALAALFFVWAARRTWWAPPKKLGGSQAAALEAHSPSLLSPFEVLHYMADESKWGLLQAAKQTGEGNTHPLVVASDEFQARAQEGKIRSYGISPETHEHEEIAKTHWMSFRLDYVTALDEQGSESCTQMAGFSGGFYNKPGYTDLKIEASDVYATWPKR
jgi:hypothetical protein